jgi:hypothetical protein
VRQGTQGFIQIRAAKMHNTLRPMSGGCIAWEFEWTLVLEEIPATLI